MLRKINQRRFIIMRKPFLLKYMAKNLFIFIFFTIIGTIIGICASIVIFNSHLSIINQNSIKTQFSLEHAPSNTFTGKVTNISGNVIFLSRTASQGKLITTPTQIQQGEEISSLGNGEATIDFSNIVSITLSPNTQIAIIQALPAGLVVQQKQGTAVYTKTGNSAPIYVRPLDLLIDLHQGSSEVLTDPDTSSVEIYVLKGYTDAAYEDIQNNSKVISIQKGYKLFFNNNTKQASMQP